MPDCSWELLDRIMATAPAIPSNRPPILIFVKCSKPTATDSNKTSSGVEVPIIEPSMGEVCDSPNIIQSLRTKPISIAAPNILSRSAGSTLSAFSHNNGSNDHNAATANDADTMAKGEMYRPSVRL